MDREEKKITRPTNPIIKNLSEVLQYISKTTVKNEKISTLQWIEFLTARNWNVENGGFDK